MKFGSRIRYLREQRKMPIRDLAIQMDISEYHLGNIERNEKLPTVSLAVQLAHYFGIGIDDIADTEEMQKYKSAIKASVNLVHDKIDLERLYRIMIRTQKLFQDVKDEI